MKLKQLFTDDDAVSPVIGVILMVAITVILAAVIGAFVLDIGGSQESAPQVQWEWDNTLETHSGTDVAVVGLSHGGGDTVESPSQISVTQSGTSWTLGGSSYTSGDVVLALNNDSSTWTASSSDYTSGQMKTSNDISSSGTLELIWESSDGSSSNVISDHDYEI
ncbi:type IV pilin [Natronoarchaeum rubrum]|uniref:type IV pilin n=1 Tax=Natronoarchaeum rubrum TaxID=755311 RepID=UPI00211218D4|nr:type IV pilin N-terminal domain-containing protein [Natronoarchaeum rubrum]